MSDSDLVKLYSGRILELAADIPHHGRLTAPDGTARKRSPLCGSTRPRGSPRTSRLTGRD